MNLDGPNGFRSVRPNAGGTQGRLDGKTIASAYDTGIFYGDAVKSAAAGGGIIELAGVGDDILGFFAGCHYDDEAGRPKFNRYWPANQVATNIVADISPTPGNTYLVQATTIAAANIGQYCDLQVGTGDPKTGNSGAEINGTTYAATRTSETFKVVRISPSPDNDFGANANVEVIVVGAELEG